MKVYADYNFYTEIYGGKMEEEDFNRQILTASQYIRYLTMGASDGYDGDELKYAACSAADLYYSVSLNTNGASSVGSGIGNIGTVKSENNDGYSVTFVTEGKDGETQEELVGRKIYSEIRKWLIPTGLLRRRVRCAHDYQCGYHPL